MVKRQSLIWSWRKILSPPHPQDTAWSPLVSDRAGHAQHWPSVGKISIPSLYFTQTMNSGDFRCERSANIGISIKSDRSETQTIKYIKLLNITFPTLVPMSSADSASVEVVGSSS